MKNKYNIGEVVEDKVSDLKGTIREFEVFDDLILYYFEEGNALPENRLYLHGVKGLTNFLNKTDEEKNKFWEDVFPTDWI
jgi:hypothetical protein|tara:strand:- start:192 stop:431 length:240 start_codon:yes stop_codon:yes gene_type:complete